MSVEKWSFDQGMVVRRIAEAGDPGAPRVVWIHGLGESSMSFNPVVGGLPGYTHVLIDLPGYGRSPWPAAAPSLTAVAEGLAAWLAQEPPAIVIGHSMGGVLATLVAEQTRVRGIINIEGNLTHGDCTFSAQAAAYDLHAFIAIGFKTVKDQIHEDSFKRPELRTYHAATCFASSVVFHRHATELVELSRSNELASRFAALQVPKLYVAGVPDGICADSRHMLDQLGIPWEGVSPAGHWVYLDQVVRVTELLARFLRAA